MKARAGRDAVTAAQLASNSETQSKARMKACRLFIPLLLVCACEVETRPRKPLGLGGSLDQDWSWQGCKETVIDFSYVGPYSGVRCTWQRSEGAVTRFRDESFYLNGQRHLVIETLADERGFFAEGRIYEDGGDRYYRVMTFLRPWQENHTGPRIRDHSELEIIRGGKVLCVYSSKEDAVIYQGRIWFLGEDSVLIRGRPCREVEERLRGTRREGRAPGFKAAASRGDGG